MVKSSRVMKGFSYVCDALTQDLLLTASLDAEDYRGRQVRSRTLLDTCSSMNFITEELASTLKLPSERCSLPIETLNASQTFATRLVTIRINSCNGNYSRILKFLIVPRICQKVPDVQIDRDALKIPANITLADPTFHKPGKVDMLLGSGITLSLFSVGQINLAPTNGPELLLQKTRLGWVIGGSIHGAPHKKSVCHAITVQFDFSKFWEIEEIVSKKHLSQEEMLDENHFRAHTTRTPAGRYVVVIPYRENAPKLGNSRAMSLKRFYNTERKLNRDKILRDQYDLFLYEYVELGHMTRIDDDITWENGFYLPHHGAVKESSATTKLRVVFNGINFVGANAELKEIVSILHIQDRMNGYFANNGIRWHCVPPHSPHFGGLWEATVKSYKQHMKRVIADEHFTFKDLITFENEVEAILNSRPMFPISTGPNDPIVLTPGHFLIGDALTSLPDHDYHDTASNRLSTWQHLQKVKQHFWIRWQKEYVNELHVRHKWTEGKRNIDLGTIVVIKEDNLPPMQWVLGRIIDVHPGADGIIRTVTVKTATTTLKRNVRKLAPLPFHDNNLADQN